MITLSRFGITFTPGSVDADVKLKFEPEGKLPGGASAGGVGFDPDEEVALAGVADAWAESELSPLEATADTT
jgi:hypothetical protein